jgi:hypothetical protein
MTARQRLARLSRAYGGRPFRRGVIAATVVVMLAAGAGAASAYWSTAVTATSTATSAQLAITTANFTSNAYTFGNESLTTTGSVTVTNTTSTTSTKVPSLTLALSRLSGSSTLAANVDVTMWYQASGTCTGSTAVGAGAVSGTWASFPGLTATLAKAASATYCIRSTIADRQDPALAGGTATFVPQISAALAVNNFTVSATASASAGQSTNFIYPLATVAPNNWYMVKSSGQCMDVSGGGTAAAGTVVISYPCKTSDITNQEWQFIQDGTTGYYDIKPRSGVGTAVRADVNGSTANNSQITVRTDSSSAGQLWQPQLVSTGVYQLVNKLSGLCLTSFATSTTTMTQSICDGGTDQQHTLTVTNPIVLENLTCSTTGFGTSRRVTYSWDLGEAGPYTVQAQRFGTWYSVSPASPNSTAAVSVNGALPAGNAPLSWTNGTYNVRILDSANSTVGTDTFTVAGTSPNKYLTC